MVKLLLFRTCTAYMPTEPLSLEVVGKSNNVEWLLLLLLVLDLQNIKKKKGKNWLI